MAKVIAFNTGTAPLHERSSTRAAPDASTLQRDAQPSHADGMERVQGSILISVVVPTYLRPDLLQRCLDALCVQNFAKDAYEIIVADDGAHQPTSDLVANYVVANPAGPHFRYVRVTQTQGPAGARNRGWQLARGGVIAFTDDDTIPAPDWLSEGFAAIARGADAATGGVHVPLPARPTDWERDTGGLASAEFVTANLFVKRAALAAVGGFDERYGLAWREDSDLHFALLSAGYAIEQAPTAVVMHPVRAAPWGVSMRAQRKVFYDVLLYSKYPQLYRERIRRIPPLNYYVIVISAVVALIGLASATPSLAIAGLTAWAVLTASFCAKRLAGASMAPSHIAEMIVTSIAIPPLSLYWRFAGALRFKALLW